MQNGFVAFFYARVFACVFCWPFLFLMQICSASLKRNHFHELLKSILWLNQCVFVVLRKTHFGFMSNYFLASFLLLQSDDDPNQISYFKYGLLQF